MLDSAKSGASIDPNTVINPNWMVMRVAKMWIAVIWPLSV